MQAVQAEPVGRRLHVRHQLAQQAAGMVETEVQAPGLVVRVQAVQLALEKMAGLQPAGILAVGVVVVRTPEAQQRVWHQAQASMVVLVVWRQMPPQAAQPGQARRQPQRRVLAAQAHMVLAAVVVVEIAAPAMQRMVGKVALASNGQPQARVVVVVVVETRMPLRIRLVLAAQAVCTAAAVVVVEISAAQAMVGMVGRALLC